MSDDLRYESSFGSYFIKGRKGFIDYWVPNTRNFLTCSQEFSRNFPTLHPHTKKRKSLPLYELVTSLRSLSATFFIFLSFLYIIYYYATLLLRYYCYTTAPLLRHYCATTPPRYHTPPHLPIHSLLRYITPPLLVAISMSPFHYLLLFLDKLHLYVCRIAGHFCSSCILFLRA